MIRLVGSTPDHSALGAAADERAQTKMDKSYGNVDVSRMYQSHFCA